MPRKRKTQSGAPAQAPEAIRGGDYGQGVAREQIAETMPSVDARAQTNQVVNQIDPTPVATPNPVDMLAGAPLGLLSGSRRPNEPVTAGMNRGPGAGPEMLGGYGPRTPLRRTLEQLAQTTGDPMFARLIEKGRL